LKIIGHGNSYNNFDSPCIFHCSRNTGLFPITFLSHQHLILAPLYLMYTATFHGPRHLVKRQTEHICRCNCCACLKVPCSKYKQIPDIKSPRENYVLQTFRFYDSSSSSRMAWETNVVQTFLFFQVSESCLIVT
jgi:hypothetical protein